MKQILKIATVLLFVFGVACKAVNKDNKLLVEITTDYNAGIEQVKPLLAKADNANNAKLESIIAPLTEKRDRLGESLIKTSFKPDPDVKDAFVKAEADFYAICSAFAQKYSENIKKDSDDQMQKMLDIAEKIKSLQK